MSNAVANKNAHPLAWMESPSTMLALKTACARHVTPERLARVVLTAANRQPKLLQCTKESIWQAVLDCAAMGLEPDAWGRAYLVPYEDRRNQRTLCQLILGYKGLVELAMRSGRVRSIKAEVVCEHDTFHYSFGLNERLDHTPTTGNRGKPTFAYAYALLAEGGHVFEVLSVAEVEKIRSRSRSGNNGPWSTDWEAMARKTAIRRLAKLLPLSSEFRDAVSREGDEDLPGAMFDLPAGDGLPPPIDASGEVVKGDGEAPADPPADPPPTDPKGNAFAGKEG